MTGAPAAIAGRPQLTATTPGRARPSGDVSHSTPAAPPPRRAGRTSAWLGVLALTSAAVWLSLMGWRALSGAGDLWHALMTARGAMVGPGLLGVAAAIFLAERRWPAVRRPWLARAHLVDAGYLLLFAVVVAPLVILLDTGFAVEVDQHAHFLVLSRLALVPQVVLVGLILVGMDAMNWLAHLANHRSAPLWRLHALHHSQEDMNVFTTFRTHPVAHASYLPALIPALVLGASGTVPGAALIAYSCLATLPHANLRWTFGSLGRIVVSPAYHRLHHANTPIGDRAVVNFGFVLVCWDLLAHRAVFPTGGAPIPTGIAGRPVPIEQAARRSRVAHVVVAQLAQPFAMSAATDGRP